MDITIDYVLEKYKHRTFYLYHILGKKWGCTLDIEKRLKKQGYTIEDTEEVKEVIGIQVADRLEKILNEQEGYSYNHTQGYIVRLLARIKSANKPKKKYSKPSNPNRPSKLSNRHKKHIGIGLKKAYDEGRRTEVDKSFFLTDEYKKKMSNSFKNVWKTQKDKMMKSRARGSNNGMSKLSEYDVKFIREKYYKVINQNTPIPKGKMRTKELVDIFNVSKGTILNAVQGKRYSSVK